MKAKAKRMSKGARLPWEVWHLIVCASCRTEKFHSFYGDYKTKAQAEACIKRNPDLVAPVIRHIDIPPMEY